MSRNRKKRRNAPAPDPDTLAPSIFVSGFARTGTTTMVRILAAGGVPVIARDETMHKINVHHPDGVFEMKDVGQFLMDSEPSQTAGRVIKLVTQYLEWLPLDRPVRVVYMVRNVHEIVASLLAQRVVWEDDPVSAIRRGRKILSDFEVPQLDVRYSDMVAYPRATVQQVADFAEPGLGVELDRDAMCAVIDPESRKKAYAEAGQQEPLVTFRVDPDKIHTAGWVRR